MFLEVLFKYIHFLSIFTIIAMLVTELVMLKPVLKRGDIQLLARIDAVYGISAITLLIAGFTLWFGVGKTAEFYTKNWIFITKLGLFVVVGLLSIKPTVFFNRKKKSAEEQIEIPGELKILIAAQLVIIAIIPLTATLMAKGIGYSE